MSDRDQQDFEDELATRLHSAGRSLEPTAGLHDRVRHRLEAHRRRRRAVQAMSATALLLTVGVTTLVLTNDDRPGRLTTSDQSTPASDGPPPPDSSGITDPSSVAAPGETFPAADDAAVNILVVGADNGACIDPDSQYAPAFGDRTAMGDRSDTIMIVRVDPAGNRASILSFPRDLWVQIDGRSARGRINSAFVRDDPQRLIDTIHTNFGIAVDHFVQVDFCGFTTVVDAVGGVAVPFDAPVRDVHTGLNVPEAGCRTLNGDEALAYVRSRHLQRFVDGSWVEDPSADLGRVARQQDFVQRTVTSVFSTGLGDVGVVRDLIGAVQDYVVVDRGLTIAEMLSLAGELRSLDTHAIGRYEIEADSQSINGNAVLVPRLTTSSMQSILALFGGEPNPTETADSNLAAATPVDNLSGQLPPPIACP